MTFTATINNDGKHEYFGRKKVVTGTIVNTSSAASGKVKIGFRDYEYVGISMVESGTTAPTITYLMDKDSEGITFRAAADTTTLFMAVGE